MDFVYKTQEQSYNTKRYHFWMFRVNDRSLRKELLWRGINPFIIFVSKHTLAYYKNSSAFIFVYDITNPESFEILEEAVKSVLKVVPENEFFGILIGNKADLEDQRVDFYLNGEF